MRLRPPLDAACLHAVRWQIPEDCGNCVYFNGDECTRCEKEYDSDSEIYVDDDE